MSWFDATGLASIAKTALKEAQKTIDKALDIKDEDANVVPTNTPVDTNSDDFFGSWGISQLGNIRESKPNSNSNEVIVQSPVKNSKMTTSLWGSFTGSFFESSKENRKARTSVDSLDDSVDLGDQHFSQSKLVVQHSDDVESSVLSRLSSCEIDNDVTVIENKTDPENFNKSGQMVEVSLDSYSEDTSQNQVSAQPVVKRREHPTSAYTNRLSAISSESGKTSIESVEVLTGTGCTTTPDSEALSLGLSISTSSSALGLKQTSESVEVLPDSLTSPSSVEVLGTDSTNGHRLSQYTDEFVSPLQSPAVEDKASARTEKTSPDSVEVIHEDENSAAEDSVSYKSISESTSATLLDPLPNLKSQKPLKDLILVENMSESVTSDISLSPDKNIAFNEPIMRGPSRSSMHLSLTHLNSQLIDTQPQSSKDLPNLLENSNVIDIPQQNEGVSTSFSETQGDDEGSQSDRTVITSDNVMESSSDTSTTTDSNTNSFYLTNMIADAMTEKSSEGIAEAPHKSSHFMDLKQGMIDSNQIIDPNDKKSGMLEDISITQLEMPPRETSPLSSESRSDLVKIGSDQTSGHTSGDEVETNTSSDIEIISSPNGDSSSNHSRHSPAKLCGIKHKSVEPNVDALLGKLTFKKIKGHNRELSEASSISDDCHSTEIDRLLRRVSEMTEILEAREAKLIEMNRRNVELQERNIDLRDQLDAVLTKQMESADLSQVTEEYTQRLSALEKKFQQAIREKDSLRKQLEHYKHEAASRISKGETETLISEKDEIIKELREEGEKLSKQQLQHSNIIKKLRAKEKEQETSIKHLKEHVEDLSSETERLKRSLVAKEDVERSQIEAVHQLTAKNKKSEYEISQLQSQVDDVTQKYETVKKSLDAAKKELIEKNKTSHELQARDQMLQSLENEKRMTESQNEEIINQLEDLRFKLSQADQELLKKEQAFRTEKNELLRRLEEAEMRNEELSQSVMEVSKPLVRQLESLQATHNFKLANFEKVEQGLLLKINEAQSKLQSAIDAERFAREECFNLRSKVSSLETQLNSATNQVEILRMQLEQQKTERIIVEQELKSEIETIQHKLKTECGAVDTLHKEISALEQQLVVEKAANEGEKRKNVTLQEQIRERPEPLNSSDRVSSPTTRNTSPTFSIGRLSLSESLGSTAWQTDEQLEMGPLPRYTNMFEMQMLQTNLKQKEGEVQQLQWELNRREHERTLLNTEISTLITRVEILETKCSDFDTTKSHLGELQQQYDTLCQLYGEKVEEAEELKLDLQDVKEMYKTQLDELLRQQKDLQ